MNDAARELVVTELARGLGGIDRDSAEHLVDATLRDLIDRGTTAEGFVTLISTFTPLKPRHDSTLARAAQIAREATNDHRARKSLLDEAWKRANPLWTP